jgi:hypothetical protein
MPAVELCCLGGFIQMYTLAVCKGKPKILYLSEEMWPKPRFCSTRRVSALGLRSMQANQQLGTGSETIDEEHGRKQFGQKAAAQ